ncbi:MAG: nucleoside-diphosphate kinase [Elusimicrobiales bacterium]|jgi:nucleoside-diphosphate kinase|nr:nucleoside-diphosphate kinase [Elusimicrobiales bacterium]HOJ86023.1 nucleoside-diphosphate kinase [Elusimicrobiales bacterium]HOL62553.1 nucleoside-diphosphate kinase [Elusimicrobiales bacterium]HPO94663.1 nucleoside-diphosphate kinase [Elusimicrobiales bacterium]
MAIEKTLLLIKPDAAKRKLTGLIIDRLENSGFELVGAKLVRVTEELAREHYSALKDQPFFENLIKYIRGEFHGIKNNKILALVYKGENVISEMRKIVGKTNPEEADPDTIRGSFGRITTKGQFENVIHASGNKEDAEKEVKLWFKEEEIIE